MLTQLVQRSPGRKIADCVVLRDESGLTGDFHLEIVRKFPKTGMWRVVSKLSREMIDGSLYLGVWEKGEVQLTGIIGVIANRFWVEVEYAALFPPKKEGDGPIKGTYRNIVWTSGIESAAAAFPITVNGEVALVRQFRHASRRWEFEIPRGVRESGETGKACGLREAAEEAGAVPTEHSKIVDLGIHQPDTGIIRMAVHIYGITNTVIDETQKQRDGTESHLETVLVPIPDFLGWVRDGRITDGWTTGGFTRAMAHGLIDLSLLR